MDQKFTIPLGLILDKKEVFNQLKSNKKNLKRFDTNSDKKIDKHELEKILKEYIDGNHSLYTDLNIKEFKDVKICISGNSADFGRKELEDSGTNLVNYRSEKLIVNDLKSSIEARLFGGFLFVSTGYHFFIILLMFNFYMYLLFALNLFLVSVDFFQYLMEEFLFLFEENCF